MRHIWIVSREKPIHLLLNLFSLKGGKDLNLSTPAAHRDDTASYLQLLLWVLWLCIHATPISLGAGDPWGWTSHQIANQLFDEGYIICCHIFNPCQESLRLTEFKIKRKRQTRKTFRIHFKLKSVPHRQMQLMQNKRNLKNHLNCSLGALLQYF